MSWRPLFLQLQGWSDCAFCQTQASLAAKPNLHNFCFHFCRAHVQSWFPTNFECDESGVGRSVEEPNAFILLATAIRIVSQINEHFVLWLIGVTLLAIAFPEKLECKRAVCLYNFVHCCAWWIAGVLAGKLLVGFCSWLSTPALSLSLVIEFLACAKHWILGMRTATYCIYGYGSHNNLCTLWTPFSPLYFSFFPDTTFRPFSIFSFLLFPSSQIPLGPRP